MTEQEVYNALIAYCKMKDADYRPTSTQFSFVVIVSSELDGENTLASTLIDPDIPGKLHGMPVELETRQQAALYVNQGLGPVILEAGQRAHLMGHIRDTLGIEKMRELADQANSGEEFAELVAGVMENDEN